MYVKVRKQVVAPSASYRGMKLRLLRHALFFLPIALGYGCETETSGADSELPEKSDGAAGKADGSVPGWDCRPSYYGTDDGCDCGCGIIDPDCGGDASADACDFEYCDGADVDADDNAVCASDEGSWTCSEMAFDDGSTCDCGCGILDPDCDSEWDLACDVDHCPGWWSPDFSDNSQCGPWPNTGNPHPDSGGDSDSGDSDSGDSDSGDGDLPPDCEDFDSSQCTAGHVCQNNYPEYMDRNRCWWRGEYSISGCESRTLPGTNLNDHFDCLRSDCVGDWHCGLGEVCGYVDRSEWTAPDLAVRRCEPVD